MLDKKQRITHVPDKVEVTRASQLGSSASPATPDDATEPVTLATLAGDIAELRLEVGVIVEWLETFEQRLADED